MVMITCLKRSCDVTMVLNSNIAFPEYTSFFYQERMQFEDTFTK